MKNSLSPSEFLKLPEEPQPTKRFFTCLCDNIIYVSRKPSGTVRCPKCKSVWKLCNSFAAGTKENKGFQLFYQSTEAQSNR